MYSSSLQDENTNRFSKLWTRLTADIDRALKSKQQKYVFPLPVICKGVAQPSLYTEDKKQAKDITIIDVCPDIQSCSKRVKPTYMTKNQWGTFSSAYVKERNLRIGSYYEIRKPAQYWTYQAKTSAWLYLKSIPRSRITSGGMDRSGGGYGYAGAGNADKYGSGKYGGDRHGGGKYGGDRHGVGKYGGDRHGVGGGGRHGVSGGGRPGGVVSVGVGGIHRRLYGGQRRRSLFAHDTDILLRKEEDVRIACTNAKQCNAKKAVPLMTAIFWYKVNEMVVQRVCPQNCPGGSCDPLAISKMVLHEASLLTVFANQMDPNYWTETWKPFLSNSIKSNAFLDASVALSMVDKKQEDFSIARTACRGVKIAEACPYSDITIQSKILRKGQQSRVKPGFAKDLRRVAQVNLAKMIELQKGNLQHLELLASIKNLDENLKASVSGISRYFEGLAKFDEGIAAADIAFIQGNLDTYEAQYANIETKLKGDIKLAMGLMVGMLSAEAAEQIVYLGALAVENANPLKLVFSGPDLKDLAEQTGKVANSAAILGHGVALHTSLTGVAEDSLALGKAFIGNTNQLSSLKKVVAKIRSGQSDLGEDADNFIEEYGAYTPKTDRTQLAKNSALWSAFKDSTCDLLSNDVGTGGAILKGIANGMLLCERLEGTLAQFFTLREEIYDFQFQLVDAAVAVVRGNIGKRLAQNIKGKGDFLHANQLFVGFIMIQIQIQQVSSLYCDVIEYKQLGKPAKRCSPKSGFFRKENIDAMIAYSDNTAPHDVNRPAYIPTRAQFQGDTGFIDLASLKRGEEVIFKIPLNNTWLQKYHWTLPGQKTIPFVKSFELYLPHKKYAAGVQTTTSVTIISIAGSSVSILPPKTVVTYILPRGHSRYKTFYDEGHYTMCKDEMNNPYSLCNNLPKICRDRTTRRPRQSLLPTILSSWSIRLQINKGSKTLKWDAPSPATNLLLRAKMTFQMPSSNKKRRSLSKLAARSAGNRCCKGNTYQSSLYDNVCKPCPRASNSLLRGLYCEINK